MINNAADQVLASRAAVLVASMRPIVAWARDYKGARIELEMLPTLLSLSALEDVLLDRTLPVPGLDGEVHPVDLDAMPEEVFDGLADYLEGTPSWYGQRCSQSPRHEAVRHQHSYVLQLARPHLPALLA